MGIGLVILLLAGGILLLRGGGAADDQGSALVSDVPVAAEDEYLVVVAEFARKTQDSVDVPRRITDTLKAGDLVGILGERIRLEHSQIVVTSREKADALAEASGAQVIIWGVEDTTGLKVVVQAHGYPDKTLNELSFLIPAGQDFATTLAVDLPIAVSMNTRLMLFQRLLQDEELIAVLSLSISQKDVLEEEELNVVPTTPLDGYVMDALTAYALGDYEAADRSLSDAILLMPDDPGLYLLRWDVNLVYLSRPDRAQMDAEHIKRVLPADNLFTVLVDCYIALFAEDYPRVAEVTQGIEYRGKGDVFLQLMTYRALALLELGQFETLLDETAALDGEALEEILGLRADLAIAAIVQEMRGDDQAAEAGHEAIRTSRFLQTTSAQFTGNVPVGLILYGGYLSEANQEWVVATLAYQSGLLNDPDNYLLNWRKGIVAEQIATYPQAAEGYAQALKNAPAPFPIAAYQLAMLVQQHGEELDAPPDACRLLTQARKDAETNADFYAPLLEKIKAAWDAGGCV
jgi:tetratricopeptide (TPR) repeat protein